MTAFNIQLINVNHISAPSFVRQQNGHDKEGLTQLAASIKQHGLLQPIVVRPAKAEDDSERDNEGLWVIIAGRRRLSASKLAGMIEIPCIVADTDEARSYEMEIAENIQREQMTLADTARAVRTLMTIYNNQKKVCEVLNKSPAWVSKHLSVTSSKCPTPVQEMLDTGTVTDLETLLLVKQIAETPGSNPLAFSTLQRMMRLADEGNLNRQIARDALAKLRAPAAPTEMPSMTITKTGGSKTMQLEIDADPRKSFQIELPIKYLAKLEMLGGAQYVMALLDGLDEEAA